MVARDEKLLIVLVGFGYEINLIGHVVENIMGNR